ncbi:unnamed protein product [Discula destructiva]
MFPSLQNPKPISFPTSRPPTRHHNDDHILHALSFDASAILPAYEDPAPRPAATRVEKIDFRVEVSSEGHPRRIAVTATIGGGSGEIDNEDHGEGNGGESQPCDTRESEECPHLCIDTGSDQEEEEVPKTPRAFDCVDGRPGSLRQPGTGPSSRV